jgi:hypothetical protein
MRDPVWRRGQGQNQGKAALLASGGVGVDEIIVHDLIPEEKAALQRSAKAVRELCDQADRLLKQTKRATLWQTLTGMVLVPSVALSFRLVLALAPFRHK